MMWCPTAHQPEDKPVLYLSRKCFSGRHLQGIIALFSKDLFQVCWCNMGRSGSWVKNEFSILKLFLKIKRLLSDLWKSYQIQVLVSTNTVLLDHSHAHFFSVLSTVAFAGGVQSCSSGLQSLPKSLLSPGLEPGLWVGLSWLEFWLCLLRCETCKFSPL